MKKQIILILMVLVLGISWEHTSSAQSINAYLDYNNFGINLICCDVNYSSFCGSISNLQNGQICTQWCGPVSGSVSISYSETTGSGQWAGDAYALSEGYGYSIESAGSENSIIIWDSSILECFPQENALQYVYSQIIYANFKICDYFTPNGGVKEIICSAPVTNIPVNAPIGSPISPCAYSCGSSGGPGGPTGGSYPEAPLVSPNNTTVTPDPINIATGEDYFSSTDFSLSTKGPKLELFRKYRSFSTIIGMFGYGWRTDYDVNLSTDSSGDVIIYDKNGTGMYFMNNSGTYVPSPGNYSTIIKNTDGTYTITDKHGIVTHYGINGRLSSRTDRNGNTLTFVYNPSVPGGTYIQDASGRQIKLYFNSNGYISSAVDPAGKTFQYGYDTNGNLASITDPTTAVTSYTYNSNHQITQFTNANGHNRYYQYDSQGRAVMTWQDSNVNKVSLNYEANNTTVLTDSLGNNNTFVFNDGYGYGLLTIHTDPLGNVTQQAWDPFMDMISKTDARNNVTNYEFNGEGNPLRQYILAISRKAL